MKIEIKTKFTKMSFEMTEDNANELIAKAVHYSQSYLRGQGKEPKVEEAPVVEIVPKPEPKPFITRPVVPAKDDIRPYRGFMYIKCEKCGREKAYCAKIPRFDHRCECGHHTELMNLKPAHVNCKCGGSFTYMTNIQDDGFTMPCFNCGSKVDMVLNGRETAYIAFGRMGVR